MNNFFSYYVFWPVEFKFDVHFYRPEPETLDNQKKNGLDQGKWTSDFDSTTKKK